MVQWYRPGPTSGPFFDVPLEFARKIISSSPSLVACTGLVVDDSSSLMATPHQVFNFFEDIFVRVGNVYCFFEDHPVETVVAISVPTYFYWYYTFEHKYRRAVTVSAPGKALVAGGYLVLEHPNVGVVVSCSSRCVCMSVLVYLCLSLTH